MRSTIRHELTDAVSAYDDKPREQWLFDFAAQVALCSVQIWWTTEVNIAFGRLEEGYDNALKEYNKKQVTRKTNSHRPTRRDKTLSSRVGRCEMLDQSGLVAHRAGRRTGDWEVVGSTPRRDVAA